MILTLFILLPFVLSYVGIRYFFLMSKFHLLPRAALLFSLSAGMFVHFVVLANVRTASMLVNTVCISVSVASLIACVLLFCAALVLVGEWQEERKDKE